MIGTLRRRLADPVVPYRMVDADVVLVAPGTLANDGKVIEDARSYR